MKESLNKILIIIVKSIWIFIVAVMAFISYFLLANAALSIIYYKDDMNHIEEKLNDIPDVEVIDIYGYMMDYYIKNVHVRVSIKDKGTILLSYVDKAQHNYPRSVRIEEVNGYKFDTYQWYNGGDFDIGSYIDIGEKDLGEVIGLTFNSVEVVINNFDSISSFVDHLKPFPELTHFKTSTSDVYISKQTYAPDWFSHYGRMDMLHLDVLFLKHGCKNKEEFFEKLRKDY